MMKLGSYKTNFDNYLGFFAALMILIPRAIGPAILGFVAFIVYGMIKKQLQFKMSAIAILFILFYLAYFVGVFYTHNDQLAYSYLEYKLSFIISPLLLSFHYKEGDYSLRKLAGGLIIGVALTGLYGIYNAMLCYSLEGNWLCFLTGSISPVHHPSYFMAYVIIAVVIAWIGFRQKWKGYSLYWLVPFTLLSIGLHIFSLSLAGILYMLLVICGVLIYLIYERWGKLIALGSLFVLPFLAYIFVTTVPQIEGEWNGAKWYADEYIKDPNAFVKNAKYPMSGSQERLIMWTVAFSEFKEHPWGVGTGNVDEYLGKRLLTLNQVELAERGLNPHNQFLQTAVEIGLIGLILLVMILGVGIGSAIKNRNFILLIIVACLMFNCLFESMLQRQSGVVFFTFWICLLVAHKNIHVKSKALIP